MSTEPQNQNGGHDVPLTPPRAPAPGGAGTGGDSSGGVPSGPASSGPASSGGAPAKPGGSGGRVAAIAIAAWGGVMLLGTGGSAAFAAVHDVAAAAQPESADRQSVSTDGIESLSMDASASSVTVRFGDVDEATLEVTGSRSADWRLDRDGDELVVRSPDRWFGGLFGGDWFGGDWFDADDEEVVVLTLPESLERSELDADFSLSAGSLDVEGGYGEVDIDMSAGGVSMNGSAASIDVDISAGSADLTLFDVEEADFSLSAGKIVAEIADTAPRSVTIDVSAGTLDLTLPDEAYALTRNVSAGSLDDGVRTSDGSQYAIDARVSAGEVILRPAD